MTIPQKLAIELVATKSLIGKNGELPARYRKKILQLIEDLSVPENVNAGYLRRARLGLICSLEVLLFVRGYHNVFLEAQKLLMAGDLALSGKYEMTSLEIENGKFHTSVINLLEFGESAFRSVYAGMCCFSAINTILYDTNFDLLGEDEKTVDPDDWDVGYYASLAKAGSAIWEDKGGEEERSLFWNWYLDIAIPDAWDVGKRIL